MHTSYSSRWTGCLQFWLAHITCDDLCLQTWWVVPWCQQMFFLLSISSCEFFSESFFTYTFLSVSLLVFGPIGDQRNDQTSLSPYNFRNFLTLASVLAVNMSTEIIFIFKLFQTMPFKNTRWWSIYSTFSISEHIFEIFVNFTNNFPF